MADALQKALKDSFKAKSCIVGSRSVLGAMSKSKLVVVSASASPQIAESAQAAGVPVVRFAGSSVELSRMCSRQYRISALAFTKLAASAAKAIVGESEKQ